MPYGVLTRKACKTSVTFFLHEQKRSCGLLRHSYSYIYVQETDMLKAKDTTGMIGQVILSIDGLPVHLVSSFFYLDDYLVFKLICC